MSDKPISVGDLVMVVKPGHCGDSGAIGRIFTVAGFFSFGTCIICNQTMVIDIAMSNDARPAIELSRLKRIDPPAHGESLPTREELTA